MSGTQHRAQIVPDRTSDDAPSDDFGESFDPHDRAVSDVLDQLVHLTRRNRNATKYSAAALDPRLEPAGYMILATIVAEGSMRATELAAMFGMDKATVSRQVRSLDDLGLIERRTDPDDARAQLLRPTEAGRSRYRAVRQANIARTRQAMQDWSEDELHVFAQLLARYNRQRRKADDATDLGVTPDQV